MEKTNKTYLIVCEGSSDGVHYASRSIAAKIIRRYNREDRLHDVLIDRKIVCINTTGWAVSVLASEQGITA